VPRPRRHTVRTPRDDAGAHTVALAIAADHPAFAGHFPGRPLLPGVALLSEVLEAVLAEPALAASVGAHRACRRSSSWRRSARRA
jgi:3-hydroxymyristoyl/3-hydroxydecanoyl-(acyl carrier protein) dehydratase